jgi:hypothetical protein
VRRPIYPLSAGCSWHWARRRQEAGSRIRRGETFLEAAGLARRLPLPDELARAALGYGGRFAYARAGADRRLVRLLEAALAALQDGDSDLRAKLLARLAGALRSEPSMERRAALSREAIQMARRLANPVTLAYALESAYASVSPRDAEAWLTIGNQLVPVARAAEDREREFIGHQHGLGALMVPGASPPSMPGWRRWPPSPRSFASPRNGAPWQ